MSASNSKTPRAKVTPVPFGKHFTLMGILDHKGCFYVTASQTAELFSLTKSHAARDLKALLPKGSPLAKLATEINSNKVAVLTLEQFNLVTFELSIRGNSFAIEFGRALQGVMLHQLFCNAFNIRFESEQIQAKFSERLRTKRQYERVSACVDQYYQAEGRVAEGRHYATAADAMNIRLFGKTSKVIRKEIADSKIDLIRDVFGYQSLTNINSLESAVVVKMASEHIKSDLAVDFAADAIGIVPIDFRS